MENLIKKVLIFGLFFVVIIFNPFTVAFAYLDSTQSFSFIASSKIYLLMLLNFIILILWTIKIQKTHEFKLINSPIYLPLLLWFISIILSTLIFTSNKNISFWGFNATLENSLIENLALIIFFLILINNIEKIEDIKSLIRSFILGVNVTFIYLIVRFINNWQINDQLLGQFLNWSNFSLLGHYGSSILIALISIVLSLGIILSEKNTIPIKQNNNLYRYIDLVNLFISSITFGVLINIKTSPQYLELILLIISVVIIVYLYFSVSNPLDNKQKSKYYLITYTLTILILGTIIGSILNIYVNKSQPPTLSNVKLEHTWLVVLDSIKQDYQKGIFGNGVGTFAHSFDKYKSEALAIPMMDNNGNLSITNFSVNGQLPQIEEIRIYQTSSILLNILHNQGLLGIVSFILILITIVYTILRKRTEELNLLSTSILIVFGIITILSIFFRYDFIILFTFWFILGLLVILYNKDDPYYNFKLEITSKFDYKNNFAFLLPLFISLIILLMLIITFKIIPSNYLFLEARKNIQNLDLYENLLQKAYFNFPESNLIGREYLYSKALKLDKEILTIEQITQEQNDNDTNINLTENINRIINIQNEINQIANNLIIDQPEEYRNYFLLGLITSRISEIQNFSQDEKAIILFSNALSKNPFHPESHYNRSKILLRNTKNIDGITSSYNEIIIALKYRPNNVLYTKQLADIESTWATILYENYKQTEKEKKQEDTQIINNILNIFKNSLSKYKLIEKLYKENQDNRNLKDLYENQKMEEKIKNIEKTIKEIEEKIEQQNKVQEKSNKSK